MKKFILLLSYDGTEYSGWQVQTNATSIQTLIESALSTLLRHKVSIVGSGRTDAGVHALGQTAHFSTDCIFAPYKLLLSLNALLPMNIRALAIKPVDSAFHARYSAIGKIYRYYLHVNPVRNPFKRLYSLYIPYILDLSLLKSATTHFIGKKDFTSFANESHRGSAAHNPIRTLKRIDLIEDDDGLALEFEGDGFLYKMVRNITGTLLDVARGKLSPDAILALFTARDRRLASQAVPAHGLFLIKVLYEQDYF